MPNLLDIIVFAILAVCVVIGWKKGFVITVFNFFSLLITLFLTNMLYPTVSVFLRGTGLFAVMKTSVADALQLDAFAENMTRAAQAEAINALALPEFIKTEMLANNNPQAHAALAVSGFEDYISGFLAGLALNALAMLAVFAVVFLLMKLIALALNILTRLPVIHSLNKLLGVAVGAVQGVVLVWVALAVLVGIFAASTAFPVGELLPVSVLAKWFYENNLVMRLIVQVFG